MDWVLYAKAFSALIFVIGLMLLLLWSVKYLEIKGVKNRFMQKLCEDKRINVIEYKKIDAKNSLVLVQKDDKEYFILLGSAQNEVLESKNKVEKTDEK